MTEQIIFILILRVAEPFIPQDNDSLKISVCLQLCFEWVWIYMQISANHYNVILLESNHILNHTLLTDPHLKRMKCRKFYIERWVLKFHIFQYHIVSLLISECKQHWGKKRIKFPLIYLWKLSTSLMRDEKSTDAQLSKPKN